MNDTSCHINAGMRVLKISKYKSDTQSKLLKVISSSEQLVLDVAKGEF